MYKKAWCACKVVVLYNKPIAFYTSSLPSPSSLLKLPKRTLRSNDATATRTSLKKWICVLSVLIAIVDTNLLGHPPSSEREITFRRCLFTFSTKREIRHFHVAVVKKRQRKCSKNLLHVCSSCCFACQTYFFYVLAAVASSDLEVLNVFLCKLMSFLRKKGV